MLRPESIAGFVTPWVAYADALEAHLAEALACVENLMKTGDTRIAELEAQVAELQAENEHLKKCAELANDISDYNNR